MIEIDKAYSSSPVEAKWYKYWQDQKLFRSEVDETKTPYTIVIPPPNITGMLHLGHVLNNTIQDILIRHKRMQGFNACWVPGTDHASIATEAKVVHHLAEQGIGKKDIGREEFLKHCHIWKDKYGGIIISQLKKLGISCDWERLRFTMDDHYYQKVIESFVKLYKDGLIYRGYRMVNWDPKTQSAISDEEVYYQTMNIKLVHIRYPMADGSGEVVVATTRPETMFGDTAVAVNPNDERYTSMIGKKVILPLTGREIEIIADDYVDSSFGTGAVKMTPAHDVNDYEVGLRHNLQLINILHPDATLNENAPKEFWGLDRYEARKKAMKMLEEQGYLVKSEDYTTNIGFSQRGHVQVEPYMSEQWFMKMDDLAKPALKAVSEGEINFYPPHWVKTYEHWMANIKDWCISRQLWWGHRIPVWYHKDTKEIYCDVNPPADAENWIQDNDVLDTWASSWLWAHDVFMTEEEQEYYYPTDTLVTAPDIIFFWVARMIMAGYYFQGKIPFKHVYFTSVIRDDLGRKMSKSLGNSPDPLDVIDQYGADALRFTMMFLAPLGQDVRFSEDKCEIGRNFANKIWNAGRFILMNTPEGFVYDENYKPANEDFVDHWIDSRLNSTVAELNKALDDFELTNSSKLIYAFIWSDFCDWYIELIKNRFYSDDPTIKMDAAQKAVGLFDKILRMLHPFMPFISEELWHLIKTRNEGDSISVAAFPEANAAKIDPEREKQMEFLQELITAVRNIRGEMKIAPSKNVKLHLKTAVYDPLYGELIKKLAKVEEITSGVDIPKPPKSASAVIKDCEIFVPLEGLIDIDVERNRLEKEIERIKGGLMGLDKKLSNQEFVSRAPADIIERERNKKRDWEESLSKLEAILADLS